MIYFLSSHSLWISGTILIGLGTVLSMLGPALSAAMSHSSD